VHISILYKLKMNKNEKSANFPEFSDFCYCHYF